MLLIIALTNLALSLGFIAVVSVPYAIFSAWMLLNLSDLSDELHDELLWQGVATIATTVLLVSLSLWVARRTSSMWRARKG